MVSKQFGAGCADFADYFLCTAEPLVPSIGSAVADLDALPR